jgi:hypothetical protein
LIEAEYLRAGLADKAATKKYYPERSGGVEIFLAALAWPFLPKGYKFASSKSQMKHHKT